MELIERLYTIFLNSAGVCTDSRHIVKGSMFFALKGDNFDGNNFVKDALEAGACCAVCDNMQIEGDDKIIKTNNVLETLQNLARRHRRELNIPVVGLTGSNGKTTTKELITAVLNTKYKTGSTIGNLNNHIGVPLTILQLSKEHGAAVIEMGASAPGEIALLSSIASPDIGLITNVGKAHLEGFGSFEGVKRTKGELYDFLEKSGGTVLYNSDNLHLKEMISARVFAKQVRYGVAEQGVKILKPSAAKPWLSIVMESGRVVNTKLIGDYNTDNILAALKIGELLGTDYNQSIKAIEDYVPSNNRSQLLKGEKNTLIIDAYNANPTSMAASINNFTEIEEANKVLILGDMLELGEESLQEHISILKLAEKVGAMRVFLVGEEFNRASLSVPFSKESVFKFNNSILLNDYLQEHQIRGAFILIKGSRGIRLERVIDTLK